MISIYVFIQHVHGDGCGKNAGSHYILVVITSQNLIPARLIAVDQVKYCETQPLSNHTHCVSNFVYTRREVLGVNYSYYNPPKIYT